MECKHVLGLTGILLLYLCMGAAIFQATEKETEQNAKLRLQNMIQEFKVSHNNCVSDRALIKFITDMVQPDVRQGWSYSRNIVNSKPIWDFAGAFTFAVTIVTTIGYGHVYPYTILGRSICVVYALFGIPLTLIVLGGIGEQLNKIAQKLTKLEICIDKPVANKAFNISILCISGFVVMFLVPSLVFWTTEGWTLLECFYYCFITLSTIGFGDYIAGHSAVFRNDTIWSLYRIAVYLWILVGLAYISLVIKFISKLLVSKAEKVQRQANKRIGSQRLNITDIRDSKRRNGDPEQHQPDSNSPTHIARTENGQATIESENYHRHRKLKLQESFSLDTDDVHLESIRARVTLPSIEDETKNEITNVK